MVHLYKTSLLTTHDQDQTRNLILKTAPGSDISWYYTFLFNCPDYFNG